MTKTDKQQYDVYIDTLGTGLIKAAQVVLLESSGRLSKMDFRYTEICREHTGVLGSKIPFLSIF
ncbi:MAG: hypothetical protein QM504_10125 [Pseudomonadota bacterium]